MKVIMKFGGSLLGSKNGISRVAKIVGDGKRRHDVVVVVSAIGDVTDILLDAAQESRHGSRNHVGPVIDRLRRIHMNAIHGSGLTDDQANKIAGTVERLLENLRLTLTGVYILGELSQRSRDMIVSFGERMSAPVVAAALEAGGISSKPFLGGEAGIITDESYGEASLILPLSRRRIVRTLSPLISKGSVPVVTGFIAATRAGDITTLGRGGSDYTATILADALGADEVWIWTDVDGIMTADPRLVRDATVLDEISYAEAEEMAFFGAKNMHPLALGPARLKGIPVRIKNGFRPNLPGTAIVARERKTPEIAKAVALVRDVGLVTVSGEAMVGRPGTAARVFGALGAASINILMISQSASELNMSMVVRRQSLDRAAKVVSSALSHDGVAAKIGVDPEVAVLAAVGTGMRGTPGIASRILEAITEVGVNVKVMVQGSTDVNMSLVVKEADAAKALSALHSAIVSKPRPF